MPIIKNMSKNVKNIPQLGGQAVLKKYGRKHFKNLVKDRWAKEHDAVQIRRERLKAAQAKGRHTAKEWHALKDIVKGHCVRCGKESIYLTKDHIIPIYQGGSDAIKNIQPLCKPCNSQKGAETINWLRRWQHAQDATALKAKTSLATGVIASPATS